MSNLSTMNPQGRFTGLADHYAKHRPSYPPEAIDFLVRRLSLSTRSLLVDAGCGTGIAARLFAARGIPVTGIEPNDDMRAQAENHPPAHGATTPIYRRGSAEATGLPSGCADAVLAAQAFHWFAPDKALPEFHRLLKPGGWLVLLWNERDESDPFTHAYGDVLRTVPQLASEEHHRQTCGRVLWDTPLFVDAQECHFANFQTFTVEALIGRAFSISYLPRDEAARAAIAQELRAVFAHYQREGQVRLHYRTSIQMARCNK